jgi:hypothetical protein
MSKPIKFPKIKTPMNLEPKRCPLYTGFKYGKEGIWPYADADLYLKNKGRSDNQGL